MIMIVFMVVLKLAMKVMRVKGDMIRMVLEVTEVKVVVSLGAQALFM